MARTIQIETLPRKDVPVPIQIVEESVTAASLATHAEIPASFQVETILGLTLVEDGLGGVEFSEKPVGEPWVKDYDDREAPSDWAERFDVSNWILLGAYDSEERVGGAVVALDTSELHMLDGRQDLAVLWDLRVTPEARGSGVGESLFRAAETSSRSYGCHSLKVETQNINVPAVASTSGWAARSERSTASPTRTCQMRSNSSGSRT